jgi:3-dehydroquinate dehydratase type I
MAGPRICVAVPATTTADVLETIHHLKEPDLVELRLDYAAEALNLKVLRKSTDVPLIATVRLPSHGGKWVGGEDEKWILLRLAADEGFDYVDAEIDSPSIRELASEVHAAGAKLIISRHYFDRAPGLVEIIATHGEARGVGADVVKVVGSAACPADNLPCFEYLGREPGNVCFNMGLLGVPSRVLSPLMGGCWTYASASDTGQVASGQLTIEALKGAYRLMGVSS